MRCYYLSDLHLESQEYAAGLPKGDVLIMAGDLCNARCLDPTRTDKYSVDQRARVLRLVDQARANFAHVIAIAGNHDHYDGVFEDTIPMLRTQLPGVTVLDNEAVEIGGVRFFGSTLWSDYEGRNAEKMDAVRRRIGEYFFVKTRRQDVAGQEVLAKFRPEDAVEAFDKSVNAMQACIAADPAKTTIVVTHHAPSWLGLNEKFTGGPLDGAYASRLDSLIERLESVPVWVHGHTHVRRSYTIGKTRVVTNARGLEAKDAGARDFRPTAYFEI
jgi:Icc-related predicted phosphoesterase